MRKLLGAALLCLIAVSVHAQAVDATVCDVLKDPQSFNGKMVRIKGTVSSGLDEFIIRGEDCHNTISSIWLAYPEGTKAKSGPLAIVQMQPAKNFTGTVRAVDRAAVVLEKNKDFKQFDSLLAAPYKSNGLCLGCSKNQVSATLTGRLDGVSADLNRDTKGKIVSFAGFGNLNMWSARLVLQSVADVVPHEVDYSKVAAFTKNETAAEPVGGEGVAAVHGIAKIWGAGNPSGDQVENAAAAFGKEGEDNGVVIGFAGGNEVSARMEQKSDRDSPNGIIYNCTFDSSRLKGGNALAVALVHVGQHLEDLRGPDASTGYSLENRAWVTTALGAIGARQKTLTMPGGYLMWNTDWPKADIPQLSGEGLGDFLSKEALIGQ